jgi:hypothetical protein
MNVRGVWELLGRFLLASVCLVAISAVLLFSGVQTATANVPTILKIDNLSDGTTGKIRVTVSHEATWACCGGMVTGYIDIIEVDVDGKVQEFTYEDYLPLIQDNPFTVELDLGKIGATSVVKVRAHCTEHGWSSWSDTVPVPEFPWVGLVSAVALGATLLVTKRQSQIARDRSADTRKSLGALEKKFITIQDNLSFSKAGHKRR